MCQEGIGPKGIGHCLESLGEPLAPLKTTLTGY